MKTRASSRAEDSRVAATQIQRALTQHSIDSQVLADPSDIIATLDAYREVGIDAFILSGYPHLPECDRFARLVLDRYPHGPLPR